MQEAVDRLSEAKIETKRTISENLPLLEATKECLNLRDRRRQIDLVEDEVYYEVKKVSRFLEFFFDNIATQLAMMLREW